LNDSASYDFADNRAGANHILREMMIKQIQNPFSYMLAAFDPRYFIGRYNDCDVILEGVTAAQPSSFGITGNKTIGKTTLLKFLSHKKDALARHRSLAGDYRPKDTENLKFLYKDFFLVEGAEIVPALYETIYESGVLSGRLPTLPGNEEGRDVRTQNIKERLEDALKGSAEHGLRLVLCLDHLDTALRSIKHEDELFLRSLTPFISFIIATELPLTELKEARLISSAFLQVLKQRQLELLTEHEAIALVQAPLEVSGNDFRFSPEQVKFLIETAGRHPYLLTLACEFFFNVQTRHPENPSDLRESRRRALSLQIEALPLVSEVFSIFWEMLNEQERHVLFMIASESEGVEIEKRFEALKILSRKSLIYPDSQTGEYKVFSETFRNYVCRQELGQKATCLAQVTDNLAPLDKKLFSYLVRRPNQLCTFEELHAELWGNAKVSRKGLEASIHRIRGKIQKTFDNGEERIVSVRRQGYKFVPDRE
jgi:hypothetical protein